MEQKEFIKALHSYEGMSRLIKTSSYEEILEQAAALSGVEMAVMEQRPMGGYSKGMTSGAYRFVLRDLKKNIEQYDWLYERLEDQKSRLVFANLFGYRILPAQSFLEAAYDGKNPQYFDKSIVSCSTDEVFVDCGGFIGDTVQSYINQFGVYKHIYVYEPSEENLLSCKKNLGQYRDITVRPCGVGEKGDFLSFQGGGSSGTFMTGQRTAKDEGIKIVSLDEDIAEPVTFIKMDIEGSEISALLGAKRHIQNDFPKLAICTYHIVSDMWEIPRLIDTIHPGYRFFIRHYDFPQNWETVVYAIPPAPRAQLVVPKREKKRVVSVAWDGGWSDEQLVKDCGVIPFLLHKNHRCDVAMVGEQTQKEYSNLRYTPGLEMDFLQQGTFQAKTDYLQKNAAGIDCLILHGAYDTYIPMVDLYKRLNPAGKIYMALDANSGWMDRIQWRDRQFSSMMEQCDVIGASCKAMQKHLNEKWPWAIEYIPNGFYNFTQREWTPSWREKKNVILTAGRLGTPQKGTSVLLEAFARIAPEIADWELRLAGSVEPEFEEYLSGFWERNGELRSRIHFLGQIAEREELYKEFLQAKIFALPSIWEGGTPNVIAEALTMGDAVAITKIDAYEDAIDGRRCGLACDINDIDGFADILLRLCTGGELEEMCRRAHEYALETFDMERVVARIYHMIFGEEA